MAPGMGDPGMLAESGGEAVPPDEILDRGARLAVRIGEERRRLAQLRAEPRFRVGQLRLVARGRSGRHVEIGRASCRARVCKYVEISVVRVSLKKKNKTNN